MTFPLDITTELLIDGVWTDVSADVLQRDPISITRGRSAEASQADPSTCALTFKNASGNYSPRNPSGAYFGVLGRNTPLRVLVGGNGRFYGEVSAWPPRWDRSGTDVYSPITANGVLRRLLQGAPIWSALRRALTNAADVVAYWPCEDGAGATVLASGIPGHPGMQLSGTVATAAFSEFKAASLPIPTASGVRWTGIVPAHTASGEIQLRFLLAVPDVGVAAQAAVCRMYTTGFAARWDLDVDTGGDLQLRAFDSDGTSLGSTGFTEHNVNGKLLRVSVEVAYTGSGVDWSISSVQVGETATTTSTGTFALVGDPVGRATSIQMNPDGGMTVDDSVALGHISVENAISGLGADEVNAYAGEATGDRITRLCDEEGVDLLIVGDTAATRLGAQLPKTFVELLREAAAADLGILYESRDFLGLEYRTRPSLYSQDPAVELVYDAASLSEIEPTEDDQATRNDVTVERIDGGSARAQLTTGALSVNAPPDGVGRYDDSVSVNLAADSDLPDQAGWRLRLGTVDEARYPVLGVNLARGVFTADAGLTADVEALDVGDKISVTNLPSWVSPDDTTQLAQGFNETLTPFGWGIDINCSPASPWDVALYGDATGPGEARYSSSGTVLNEDLTTTETGVDVAVPTGALWTAVDQPFDIWVGGERMTVTAVSGSSSPQTFTVTRSVNGVVKTHATGAAVRLFKPAVYAL